MCNLISQLNRVAMFEQTQVRSDAGFIQLNFQLFKHPIAQSERRDSGTQSSCPTGLNP